MKKCILLLGFILLFFAQARGGNNLFFEDGKYWICSGGDAGNIKVSVVGDTIVGGKAARKLQSELLSSGEKSKDYRICYEEDGKVYAWYNDAFHLMFDFDWDQFSEREKSIERIDNDGDDKCSLSHMSDRTVNVEGINRKLISLVYISNDESPSMLFYWFEGIGSSERFISLTIFPKSSDPFWSYSYMDECYKYDRRLYNYREASHYSIADPLYPELGAIDEIKSDSPELEILYDMSGRRVLTPQPGHIYVTSKRKRLLK